MNTTYRKRAVTLLMDDPAFAWLANKPAMEARAPNAWKPSILTELGRIDNDEHLRVMARELCRIKPKAHTGVLIVRRYRMGLMGKEMDKEGSYDGVIDALCDALDDYLRRYPKTPQRDVLEAISDLHSIVGDNDA